MKGLYNIKETKILRKELRNHSTSAEAILWLKLKGKQVDVLKFRRQYGIGNFVTDFYCPQVRLAIELDGGIHDAPMQSERDEIRTKIIEENNIKIIRFKNEEVFWEIDGVVEEIRRVAFERMRLFRPPLTPPKLGEEKEK